MGDIRGAVEQRIDTMTAVCPDHTAILRLGVLLDGITKLSYQRSGLDKLGGLIQTFPSCLNYPDRVGIRLGLIPNIIRLVQVGVVPSMV